MLLSSWGSGANVRQMMCTWALRAKRLCVVGPWQEVARMQLERARHEVDALQQELVRVGTLVMQQPSAADVCMQVRLSQWGDVKCFCVHAWRLDTRLGIADPLRTAADPATVVFVVACVCAPCRRRRLLHRLRWPCKPPSAGPTTMR